jgi:hypothetical protein
MKIKYKYMILYGIVTLILIILSNMSLRVSNFEVRQQKEVKVVLVCHTQDIVDRVLKEKPAYVDIMFVGNQPVKAHPRIHICRDLEDNIEDQPKLLTFTAWYAIIKNNLFTDYKYICILEYDVIIEEKFLDNLIEKTKDNPEVVSFFINNNFHEFGFSAFIQDVNVDILNNIILKLNTDYDVNAAWYHSTNHCIRRDVLSGFVGWYSSEYPHIKEKDYKRLSWYHERLFMVYNYVNKHRTIISSGLQHNSSSSHTISKLN